MRSRGRLPTLRGAQAATVLISGYGCGCGYWIRARARTLGHPPDAGTCPASVPLGHRSDVAHCPAFVPVGQRRRAARDTRPCAPSPSRAGPRPSRGCCCVRDSRGRRTRGRRGSKRPTSTRHSAISETRFVNRPSVWQRLRRHEPIGQMPAAVADRRAHSQEASAPAFRVLRWVPMLSSSQITARAFPRTARRWRSLFHPGIEPGATQPVRPVALVDAHGAQVAALGRAAQHGERDLRLARGIAERQPGIGRRRRRRPELAERRGERS